MVRSLDLPVLLAGIADRPWGASLLLMLAAGARLLVGRRLLVMVASTRLRSISFEQRVRVCPSAACIPVTDLCTRSHVRSVWGLGLRCSFAARGRARVSRLARRC